MAITDLPVIIVFVFIIAFMFVIGAMLKDAIFPKMKLAMPSASGIFDTVSNAFGVLDYVFMITAFGFGIATILLAFQIDTHPAFFFISLFITIISLILSPIFSNVFGIIAKNPTFSAAAESFPFIRQVMQNLPIFILVIGSMVSIVLFAKIRSGGSE